MRLRQTEPRARAEAQRFSWEEHVPPRSGQVHSVRQDSESHAKAPEAVSTAFLSRWRPAPSSSRGSSSTYAGAKWLGGLQSGAQRSDRNAPMSKRASNKIKTILMDIEACILIHESRPLRCACLRGRPRSARRHRRRAVRLR